MNTKDLVQFKKPPVVQRTIGVYHQLTQAEFEARLPAWSEKIRDVYPISEPIAEWNIEIEEKNGIPFVKSLVPKARLIHIFWKRNSKGDHVHGMQLRADRLVFHLLREGDNTHQFEELLPEMERWLPVWAEHFGVPNLEGVTLEYENLLNAETTPQFTNPNGSLRIGEILTVFANFPGPHKGLTNPYDCKARLVIDEAKPVYFDVRVLGDNKSRNGVRVDFKLVIFPGSTKLSFKDAIGELGQGHTIMLEQFACFFTDKARKSFA